jgi:hypothetical protein
MERREAPGAGEAPHGPGEGPSARHGKTDCSGLPLGGARPFGEGAAPPGAPSADQAFTRPAIERILATSPALLPIRPAAKAATGWRASGETGLEDYIQDTEDIKDYTHN